MYSVCVIIYANKDYYYVTPQSMNTTNSNNNNTHCMFIN